MWHSLRALSPFFLPSLTSELALGFEREGENFLFLPSFLGFVLFCLEIECFPYQLEFLACFSVLPLFLFLIQSLKVTRSLQQLSPIFLEKREKGKKRRFSDIFLFWQIQLVTRAASKQWIGKWDQNHPVNMAPSIFLKQVFFLPLLFYLLCRSHKVAKCPLHLMFWPE